MDFANDRLTDLAGAVQRREISARELVTHALTTIQERDGAINAFVSIDPDGALAAAGALDERLANGADVASLPLAGIPLGVKDLEDAKGLRTTRGSAIHANDPAAETDSPLVAALRDAGAIVVGKTNTPEDGHTSETNNAVSGRTANPLDPQRSPGGSSGGSAAAIAAGMVPLATGSDGGGSIRIPASLCGLSGFKPTQGTVPTGPQPPGSNLLSTRGPMTRRATDAALALSVSASGNPAIDPFGAPTLNPEALGRLAAADVGNLGGRGRALRVAWVADGGVGARGDLPGIDTAVADVTAAAVGALEAAGAEVHERRELFAVDPVGSWFTLWTASMAARHAHRRDTDEWDLLWPEVRELTTWGADRVSGADTTDAIDGAWRANNDVTAALGDADVLVLPTVAGRVPLGGRPGTINGEESIVWVRFTYPFNLTRHPAGSVRAGVDPDGMPVGLQVVGRHHDDVTVLAVMAALEEILA
jgi:aspartyl-tRNA(Asn)/glutamyl-tRNA(Gln) amidotransferase subunit A